jgi:hypothetical protein
MSDQALLLTSLKSIVPGLVETDPELIFPVGGVAYALDKSGQLCGLKIPYHGEDAGEVLKIILAFDTLERLVLAFSGATIHLPTSITRLHRLRFLWLGGDFKSLPPELLDLGLPMTLLTRPHADAASLKVTAIFESVENQLRGVGLRGVGSTDETQTQTSSSFRFASAATHIGDFLSPPRPRGSTARDYL